MRETPETREPDEIEDAAWALVREYGQAITDFVLEGGGTRQRRLSAARRALLAALRTPATPTRPEEGAER